MLCYMLENKVVSKWLLVKDTKNMEQNAEFT